VIQSYYLEPKEKTEEGALVDDDEVPEDEKTSNEVGAAAAGFSWGGARRPEPGGARRPPEPGGARRPPELVGFFSLLVPYQKLRKVETVNSISPLYFQSLQ
jgi:hypothetical protein